MTQLFEQINGEMIGNYVPTKNKTIEFSKLIALHQFSVQ